MKRLLKLLSRKSSGKLGNCDAVRDVAKIKEKCSMEGKAYGEYLHRICDRKTWNPHMSYADYNEKCSTDFKSDLHLYRDFEIYYKNTGMCDDRDWLEEVICTGKNILYTIAEALINNGGLHEMQYPFERITRLEQCGKTRDCLYFEAYSFWNPFPEGKIRINKRTKKIEIVSIYHSYDDEDNEIWNEDEEYD